MPTFDFNVALAVVFGLFVLYFVAKMLAGPALLVLRLILTGAVGAVVLLVFNLAAGLFSLSIGINAVTALVVGYMGLPGLLMLILLQRMLG
ncbi:pro-sigmaK processing inhibitor BofA family protein [Dethiobacter alkaliphilus]|uniref:SigmaK-factor processing regulatory BofA n=1 Tax=Dethiobacter alkaliphilus AHT 1 TaxID=555088 RepID=C0GJ90_DETAL|nr:pro-sigmaK processing inhibitor BofA family protein [Dethiobacter alkaliphilus]EEG76575.1 sigmaK-factor processing regulatory BofA [Dethiobacter alkaliphilus AHT 1]